MLSALRIFLRIACLFVLLMSPMLALSWWLNEVIFLKLLGLAVSLCVSLYLAFSLLSMYKQEALEYVYGLLVFIWVGLSVIAALPFWFGIPDIRWVDAWFVAVSGITTTGAEVFADLTILPKSLLFYRMWLQFLGGLGIIVLATVWQALEGESSLSVLPSDMPGSVKARSLVPRMLESAKLVWMVYVGLYFACILWFCCCGMRVFDAFCESLSVVSTGGFGLYNENMGHYDLPGLRAGVMLFMLLSSFNFIVYCRCLLSRSLSGFWQNSECKSYLFLVLGMGFMLSVLAMFWGMPMQDYGFLWVSFVTTSGHQLTHEALAFLPNALVLTFFCCLGGCVGSTTGGVKLSRVQLLGRDIRHTLHLMRHPRAVLGDVDASLEGGVFARGFLVAYSMVILLVVWLLALSGCSLGDAFAFTVACLSNTGAVVLQTVQGYPDLPDFVKYVLCVTMLLGRMEILAVLLIFSPGYWRIR